MIAHIKHMLRRLRFRVIRSEWALRHFGFLGAQATQDISGPASLRLHRSYSGQ